MTHLKMNYITARPRQLTQRQLSLALRTQVFPQPPVSVIRDSGFTMKGFDPSDAYELAQLEHLFLESDASLAYRNSLKPDSNWIHPCEIASDATGLANSLREHGLNVCFISGHYEVPNSEGFMLTASKADFSADLASAYLLAGFVPPQDLFLRGLEKNAHGALEQLYQQAAAQVVRHFTELVDQVEQFVDPDFTFSLAP